MVRDKKGFTLVEMMVVIAILGILLATSIPVYRTWQQRAYGSEAALMLKQLINAEISYYLEHEEFFQAGNRLLVWHDMVDPPGARELIEQKLNISIPQGHLIDYDLYAEEDLFFLVIRSHGGFNLFKGAPEIYAALNKNGDVRIEYAQKPGN